MKITNDIIKSFDPNVLVNWAKLCVDSVAHLDNEESRLASLYAVTHYAAQKELNLTLLISLLKDKK